MGSMKAEDLKFKLTYISGEDDSYQRSPEEMDKTFINGKGWISSRYCHYPQELVIKLHKRSNIEKIQILCHHVLISSKIEVYVGNVPVGERISLSTAKFERLGYVAFQDNKESGYQTRELKSLYVDATGWFVKFMVQENHKNDFNQYNQVGIMAIHVNGYILSDPKDSDASETDEEDYKEQIKDEMKKKKVSQRPSSRANSAKSHSVPEGKDYCKEMKQIIKILQSKKRQDVIDEKYEHAKKLKMASDKLQSTHDLCEKLQRERDRAARNDDFDRAQSAKSEIESIRFKTYEEIDLYNILTRNELNSVGLDEPIKTEHFPRTYYEEKPIRKQSPEPEPLPERESLNKPGNKFYERENTVLPTLRGKSTQSAERSTPDSSDEKLPPIRNDSASSSKEKPVILNDEQPKEKNKKCEFSDRDRQHFNFSINTFGEDMVNDTCCKNWQHRVQAMNALQLRLDEAQFAHKQDALAILTPASQLVRRCLRDKVFAVFKASLAILEYILTKFIVKHSISKPGGTFMAERTFFILITRTGDTVTDPRFKPTSTAFIMDLARSPDAAVRSAYTSRLLRPFQASGYSKIDEGHAEAAEKIIKEHFGKSGITLDKSAQFAVSCLLHTAGVVREIGVRILVWLYKNCERPKVRSYLPPDNKRTRQKNPLYKKIFEEFDKIDGRVPNGNKKNNKVVEAEIEALRKQNEEIRAALEQRSRGVQDSPKKKQSSRKSSVVPVAEPEAEQNLPHKLAEPKSDQRADSPSLDKICVFCGEENSEFDEETLDVHYLKYCPMLTKCGHCKKVIEISGYKEHLTTECVERDRLKQCPRCREPVTSDEFDKHQQKENCTVGKPPEIAERCLLCHDDIVGKGEEGWKKHLIGAKGCNGNARREFGVGGPRDDYKTPEPQIASDNEAVENAPSESDVDQ